MNILEIINKKRTGNELTLAEIQYAFKGYVNKEVKDYQMASLLMAICIKGMTDEETINLTDIYIRSGLVLHLSDVSGVKVDKHSTGGIGDKTTFVVGSVVAACGLKVPKMSGRGLGITGGTIDKLESIKGIKLNLTEQEIKEQLNNVGFVMTSQTDFIVPIDKATYELRNASGTVSSIPLIAASIMSKKIACGADKILIDLKLGKGALISNIDDANKLKEIMIKIGSRYNKETRVIITNMDRPLGNTVGNSLEVVEAINTLLGKNKNAFYDVCLELSSNMISMGLNVPLEEAYDKAIKVINDGSAYQKFLDVIKYQHGDIRSLTISPNKIEILSSKTGILKDIRANIIGEVSLELGAGRINKEDSIYHDVGIVLIAEIEKQINIGDVLCVLYVKDKKPITNIQDAFIIE